MTKDETEAHQRTEDEIMFESQPCGKPHVVGSHCQTTR
jgi:hypothetical protein